MPLSAADMETLETCLSGVLSRSEHHADAVGAVVLALIGAVLWKKDAAPIEVRTYDRKLANILRVQIGRQKYALAYNHKKESIDLRERTQNGTIVAAFDNNTPKTEIYQIFDELKPTA